MKTSHAYLKYLPALLWMGLIFLLSNQPGSDSGQLTAKIMAFLQEIGLDLPLVAGQYATLVLRKTAHFTEYFILFLWVKMALHGRSRRLLLAFLVCAAYACTDEFHQLFIPGRVGNVGDVLVDSSGAALAWALSWWREKMKAEKLKNSATSHGKI
ncbi:MAG: VanZ family protein [Bacteroidia bacterium]|nr:VanZ family protein [Bacteroidia bacterium]